MVSLEDIEQVRRRIDLVNSKRESLVKMVEKQKASQAKMRQELEAEGVDISNIPEEQSKLESLLQQTYEKLEESVNTTELALNTIESNLI